MWISDFIIAYTPKQKNQLEADLGAVFFERSSNIF